MKEKLAVVSVTNKKGLVPFCQGLVELGVTILSTGGTAADLRKSNVPVTEVVDITHFPEMLDGRVKTLHPAIHGGLLARNTPLHKQQMLENTLDYIDLAVVNLYDFSGAVAAGLSAAEIVEKIDIGGPAMLRSAAKNFERVTVVSDPGDYDMVLGKLRNGGIDEETRRTLMVKVFLMTHRYDGFILEYMSGGEYKPILGQRVRQLKYGENPWQTPAVHYKLVGNNDPLAIHNFVPVEGTDPSFVNTTDVSRALQTITHIAAAMTVNRGEEPLVAVGVKHGNSCGVATGQSVVDVTQRMISGEPSDIFGGVVMTNFAVTEREADAMTHHLVSSRVLDGVIAPEFTLDAIAILRRKNGKCRLFTHTGLAKLGAECLDKATRLTYIRGDFLTQPNFDFVLNLQDERLEKFGPELTVDQEEALLVAWAIGCTSNSNTITLVKKDGVGTILPPHHFVADTRLIGNGVGQQGRVGAADLAVTRAGRAGHSIAESEVVAYSDSFFPFTDGPQVLADAGVKAILASSGSIRDADVKAFCQAAGITLYMIPDKVGRGFFGHTG